MSNNIIKTRGTTSNHKPDAGGSNPILYPVKGIVKSSYDKTKSGKIRVYIEDFGGLDPDDSRNWKTVSYMSPFYGVTPNTASSKDYGTFLGNQHSYGFWSNPPDVGTEVICIFLQGKTDFGYYIGCVPQPGLTHMTPAVGSSSNVILNEGEAESLGGADRLPTVEINDKNTGLSDSSNYPTEARPVHSYQASILFKQGLVRDAVRGVISSSSMRESPSRVFGMSTPGRPIYEGGYTDQNISQLANASPDKAKIIARRGGHSIVMDDGDITGQNQMLRIRTALGHQITMSDDGQTLFIIHSNGQSYIELGKEGTIDMYSTNSVNIRTQGDLNLHADNNININAKKALNISGETVQIQSEKTTKTLVGTDFEAYTLGKHTLKVDGAMSFESAGDASVKSSGTTYINGGPNVNLNTGSSSTVPEKVKPLPIVAHSDTLFDSVKGYAAAPGKLSSIVSRAPAHSPWANANQGVDVKVSTNASDNLPPQPSQKVQTTNSAVPQTPENPVSPAVAATVPNVPPVGGSLDKNVTGTLVGQGAVSAALGPAKDAVAAGAGIIGTGANKTAVLGKLAANPQQLEQAGYIKPGASAAINAAIQSGKTLEQALPPNVFTNKDGVSNLASFVDNGSVQAKAQVNILQKSMAGLASNGVLTGKETPSQIAGLVNSGATAGVAQTTEFVKQVTTATVGTAVAMTSAVAKLGGVSNPNLGNIPNQIAAGNFAAAQAEKITGGLKSVAAGLDTSSVNQQLAGVSGGAFAKIVGSFKALAAKVPQKLGISQAAGAKQSSGATEEARPTYIRDPNTGEMVRNYTPEEEAQMKESSSNINRTLTNALGFGEGGVTKTAMSNIGSSIGKAVSAAQTPGEKIAVGMAGIAASGETTTVYGNESNGVASGVDALPGGANAVSNIVDKSATGMSNLPGVNSLKNLAAGITGTLGAGLSSLTGPAKQGINQAKGLSSAIEGLDPKDSAQLESAVNSLGGGGPFQIKMPSVGVNTVDTAEIESATKSLLGSDKIPMPNFSGTFKKPTPEIQQLNDEYNEVQKQYDTQVDTNWALKKSYSDAKEKYGDNSPQAVNALEQYKEGLKKADELNAQAGEISKKILGSYK